MVLQQDKKGDDITNCVNWLRIITQHQLQVYSANRHPLIWC